jgi:hypothetical protein
MQCPRQRKQSRGASDMDGSLEVHTMRHYKTLKNRHVDNSFSCAVIVISVLVGTTALITKVI